MPSEFPQGASFGAAHVQRCAVIVLTLDAQHHMPALLEALSSLPQAPRRVLFVDSSSRDATVALARGAGHDVQVIAGSDFGHGRTRNEAARLCADCEYLVYLTQDACPLGRGWLARLLDPFADVQVALVYGRQLPRPSAQWPERHAREFNYPAWPQRSTLGDLPSRGVKAVFCSNSFATYRRQSLVAVGGFPEQLPMGEDMAVSLRLLQAGHARVYQPQARAVHSHHYSAAQELRRYFDIGALLAMDPELRRVHLATSSEGLKFLRGEMLGAWRHQGVGGVLGSASRALSKALGFQLGRRYQYLPAPLRRQLSMHSAFWSRA
ncbi:MAG TPA: glycosyltransferase [Ramlibacter sp.]|nr:glycosyltransferase [Ramlibacter sp.]